MRVGAPRRTWAVALLLGLLLLPGPLARAGRLSWLDEVVRHAVRGEGRAASRPAGRLFVHEAEEGLAGLARRADEMARLARRAEGPSEALLEARFARVVRQDEALVRGFKDLAPAEKRLVVEMGETASALARRHPERAEEIIRGLGVEGLTAVRVYGDDVADVIVKEGPSSLNVLRKTGRPGWDVFTTVVLPHKKKLAAAGVLALFLANPDRFVDTAGNLTQYAVEQFAQAGVQLAGGIGAGASRGLENSVASALAEYGLDSLVLRKLGMALAGLVALGATMVLVGLPLKWLLGPVVWPLRVVRRVLRGPGTV